MRNVSNVEIEYGGVCIVYRHRPECNNKWLGKYDVVNVVNNIHVWGK